MTTNPAPGAPELVLYGKPGCHLCEETRDLLGRLLDARRADGLPAPKVVERNILTNPEWEQAYFETIPVLELAGRQLPLAIRPRQVGDFLDAILGHTHAG